MWHKPMTQLYAILGGTRKSFISSLRSATAATVVGADPEVGFRRGVGMTGSRGQRSGTVSRSDRRDRRGAETAAVRPDRGAIDGDRGRGIPATRLTINRRRGTH